MTAETIYTVGGTVQAGAGIYIPRQADAELLALCRAGVFGYVLTARQMGKSSLMTETARRLNDAGARTVLIDLTQIGTILNAEQWYLGLLTETGEQLALETDALAWWNERSHMGPAQRLTAFLREVVLAEVAVPVVLFVDEIDTTLSLDFTDDFYAAIRALYNARAQQPALARLSFVLIGVALPGDLIKDPQRTPFNIGRQVELRDFSEAETAPFGTGLGLPAEQAAAVLKRVHEWTNGHPYLTQRLCAALAVAPLAERTPPGVDALVHALFLGEQSKQDNNLQFVRDMLTRRAPDPIGVLTTYRDVLRGRVVRDDERALPKAHLKLAGVVRRAGRVLELRNRIYQRVFDERWVKENLPRDYLPRRLQRIGLIAIAVLTLLSVFLGVFLFGANSRVAELQAAQQTANSAIQSSENANRATLRQLIVSDAQAALAEGNLDQARLGAIVALRADPGLAQAEVVLDQAAFAPGTRRLLQGHTDAVESVAWSPDGRQVVSASADNTLRVWDVASGRTVRTLAGHTDFVYGVAWSLDGKQVVSASRDNTLRVWDVASGRTMRTLAGHTDAVQGVAWSPDGRQVVSASLDATLRVWDVASGRTVRTLEGHTDAVYDAAWSPDGKQVVSASADNTLRVWDVASGRTMRTLAGHTDAVQGVAWSPDGRQVVSASLDATLRVWDVASGRTVRTLEGHTDAVNDATWSPDGRQVVSASLDATLRVWDVASGASVRILRGHTGSIFSVAWSLDGKQVVSTSFDHTLRVWQMYTVQELIAWIYANRYVPALTDAQRQRYGAALVGMDAAPTASATATP